MENHEPEKPGARSRRTVLRTVGLREALGGTWIHVGGDADRKSLDAALDFSVEGCRRERVTWTAALPPGRP